MDAAFSPAPQTPPDGTRTVTDDKIYCYYVPDEFLIREHARLCEIPADRTSAVRRLLDPANFATS